MKYLIATLAVALACAAPAVAGPFFPLEPGVTWTLENDAGAAWTFTLGSPVLWHGALCHPRLEMSGSFVGRTYWSEDPDGRILLHGLEHLTTEGGVWYFAPPAVYLDPALVPGGQTVSQAGVYEVVDGADQWYGLEAVTLTCVDRDPVTTPFGTFTAIAVSPTWDAPGGAPWTYGRGAVQVYGWAVGPARLYRTDLPSEDYRLTALDGLTPAGAPPAPPALALAAAPNPFNPATVVSFSLARSGRVRLDVFDLAGRRIASLIDGDLGAGPHQVTWQPRNLGSGVYLARLATPDGAAVARLTLLE
ncbi:MAG TPA: T9SS type A sorting domain-containing protein [Candidatus Krumholzibacteria bacterium]|nr:T9SS type A sorting domain-containing protein [Candidatus Krumholzibacteria bacterium]HPD72462.1 T9SS type A sorting domain-containing protein [Candidatus Krumholzibacteria bacterium]HRY40606.1 T9SS type A sorting domain-containing protein [Candidatus Krumholzibacteria bacterium]